MIIETGFIDYRKIIGESATSQVLFPHCAASRCAACCVFMFTVYLQGLSNLNM